MVSRSNSRRGFGAIAVASFAVLGLGLAQPAQAVQGAQGAWSGRATHPDQPAGAVPDFGKEDRSITLITGDRVTLRGGSIDRPVIEPGPGRRHIAFSTQRVKDQLFVVPSDVSSAVTAGRMDRRLFEVTGLIKAGYDDRKTAVIPLLVTYSGRAASRTAPAGATVTLQLPVINGAAVEVTKKNAATFIRSLSTARSTNGLDKIWLDGRRHVNLDQSVPQIGAPAAWQAGYTSKGVTVAVLDTGIDKTHPDLATQVAGAKNFTEEAAGDLVGHGTHVASTIAGTAAASAGKYKGVAPDAKLYDGKICEQSGCPESAILAGMEWAATEVKAKIVNMSIGGPDTPEVDPIEAAVNRLTAQTGTLFVIAAGNSGPGSGSVESPGSADAALTVGAVDKRNQLAEFSSRGPRTGDGALKPDVTAPGVDIVAAKAKDSIIGDPVGDQYLGLSGTSMATPHTVGAAALLAQQHPGWKAGELKGALMASAKPADGQNAFEQGAGRIDVAQAIKQSIVTEPGGVSFGTALWPHNDDTPVTKTLSYRNLGDQSVTLALAATFAGPDGSPAPAGALKLSANTVTIPAGGTATVQLISDTKHDGPDGSYTGRVTATAAGITAVTPIGADKEVESYTLTVNHVGTDGKPFADGATLLFGIDEFRLQFLVDPSGTAEARLPKGEYLLQGDQAVAVGEQFDIYTQVHPAVELDADTTVVFDARNTKPVSTTVPRADAKVILVDLGYLRVNEAGENGLGSTLLAFGFEGLHTAQLGPKLPAEQFTGHVASHWGLPGGDGLFANTPYQYGILNTVPGEFPTGFSRSVKASDLAVVEQKFNATGDRPAERTVAAQAPNFGGGWTPILQYDLPAKPRLYLESGDVKWSSRMAEIVPSTDPEYPFPTEVTAVEGEPTPYRAGRTYRERWNAAAFVPTPGGATLSDGNLLVGVYTNTDADGHIGFTLTDKASSKLYRDGELIGENTEFGYVELADVPARKAAYKFVTTGTRASYSWFSTRTDLTWTFTAKGDAEEEFGVRTVRYLPDVDDRNVAKRQPVTVLPLRLAKLPGATLPAVKKVSLQVSGDDGKTWQRAAVVPTGGDAYKAVFATPKGAKSVSFKANLVDAAGNTTAQTTISAYQLR